MIESAEEYKHWFDAPESIERFKKLREPAAEGTLLEVIDRFPECRAQVALGDDVPVAVLEVLRVDEDELVRWHVRSNAKWLEIHPDDGEPWKDDPNGLIQLRLSNDERALLRAGLREWGGPARCTEEFAVAMGFDNVADLFESGAWIGDAIVAGAPLSRTDWTRALLATEIVFVSDVVGSGWDWHITTRFPDEETFRMLRSLQRRMVTGGVIGEAFGTRPERKTLDLSDLRAWLAQWFEASADRGEPAELVAPLLRFNHVPQVPTVDDGVEVLVVENQGVWLWGHAPDGSYVERENTPGASWRPTGEDEAEFWLHHAAFEAVWSMPAQRSSLAVDSRSLLRILTDTSSLPFREWAWPAPAQCIRHHERSLVMFSKDGDAYWVVAAAPTEAELEWIDNRGTTWDETDTRRP